MELSTVRTVVVRPPYMGIVVGSIPSPCTFALPVSSYDAQTLMEMIPPVGSVSPTTRAYVVLAQFGTSARALETDREVGISILPDDDFSAFPCDSAGISYSKHKISPEEMPEGRDILSAATVSVALLERPEGVGNRFNVGSTPTRSIHAPETAMEAQ